MHGRPAWVEVLLVSLRLGLTSFGGPVAHIGYQRNAFVVRRGWLDEQAFADLVALCQALPGPASSQLSVAIGRLRGGWPGAVAAWVGFTLPSAVLMGAVGVLVAGSAIPETGPVAGAVAGLKAAAVAVVAQAVFAMAQRLTPDAPRAAVAAVATVLALLVPIPAIQPGLIVAGAAFGWLAWRGRYPLKGVEIGAPLPRAGGRRTALGLALAWLVVVGGSWLLAAASADAGVDFGAALVRAGALVFGGGHVVLPLLDAGVVEPGWVTPDAFLAGYGVAQAMPGPLFSFGAYLGAVSTAGPGGVAGAALGTVAIFLPGMLLVLAALPVLRRFRDRPGIGAALAGTNAAVVGVLAAALVTPVATGGLTSVAAFVCAAVGAVGLLTGRVPPLVVVAGCAAAMAALAGAGVAV